MCNFFSAVVVRSGRVLHNAYEDDTHESIIAKHKLKDDKLKDRDFVRVELTPQDADFKDWAYKVDEQGTLPKWYSDKANKHETKVRKTLIGLFVVEGEHKFSEGRHFASGSATVMASGSATVEASGSATVRAWGSATVRAWGSATVEAWGSATVEASGSATTQIYSVKNKVVLAANSEAVIVDRSGLHVKTRKARRSSK
jgi:hypothetical protein